MFFSFVVSLLIFGGVMLGLAWPLAARLALDHVEKLTATVALSLLGVFLFAWLIYVCALPLSLFWILPVASAAGLLIKWRALRVVLRDPDTASLVFAQILITLWSVAWLALILSYSGGDWLADWFGHFQRTCFFLDRGPRDILFNGFDALTSRPPLANVVSGVFLEISARDFAHYQFFSTLFSSLVFLPAALFARRWGGMSAVSLLAVLFMISPTYYENATYSWTKLPATFFTLAAVYFFLRAHDKDARPVHAFLFAVTLATGLLTHYSTGPYALVLGLAWIAMGWSRRREASWQRTTIFSIAIGTLVLATWFGWAFSVYGLRGSLMTNTSITDQAPNATEQIRTVMLNVCDTFVPHFLRVVDYTVFAQRNPLGWWRDWFFTLYQTNFFFAFGCTAWAGVLAFLAKSWHTTSASRRTFWASFIVVTTGLGIAVVGGRYPLGLAHVCLQPLVLIGLAFLAAHWPEIQRHWRLVLIAGATVDLVTGILLQSGIQAYALDRWFHPDRPISAIFTSYSSTARMNFYAKAQNHWVFMGEIFINQWRVTISLLAALLLIALFRAGRFNTTPSKL